jgi:hypothetical protein
MGSAAVWLALLSIKTDRDSKTEATLRFPFAATPQSQKQESNSRTPNGHAKSLIVF